MPRFNVVVACATLAACSGPAEAPPVAPNGPDLTVEALFAAERLIEVQIDMIPSDWDALRHQVRDIVQEFGPGCLDGPRTSPYTWFEATVTVDGRRLDRTGVRKKGLIGSLHTQKPSLKLKFDHFVKDQRLAGLSRLVLNNSKQDTSYARQCLAYSVFGAAGTPAPRCGLAHVTLNGRDLGVYVTLEAYDKKLLGQFFGGDDGQLWEGSNADFRPELVPMFEPKDDAPDPDRSRLTAVTAALASPDDAVEAQVEPLLDVEEFLSFWAAEVLLAHFDGFANSANNFYVYDDPASNRLAFLPAGVDSTFSNLNPYRKGDDVPHAVFAGSALPRRLYEVPSTRDRYVARLRALLKSAWDETALLSRLDRIAALVAPHLDEPGRADLAREGQAVREFIQGRRAVLEPELDAPPAWSYPLDALTCRAGADAIHATFAAAWGSFDADVPFLEGEATLAIDGPQGPIDAANTGSVIGPPHNATPDVGILIVALTKDGFVKVLYVLMPDEEVVAGATVPIDYSRAYSVLVDVQFPDRSTARVLGDVASGTIHFDGVDRTPGGTVSGSLDGILYSGVPAGGE